MKVCLFYNTYSLFRNNTADNRCGKKHREFLAIITTPVNISVAMRSYLCVCMFPLVRVRLINDDRQAKETNGQ